MTKIVWPVGKQERHLPGFAVRSSPAVLTAGAGSLKVGTGEIGWLAILPSVLPWASLGTARRLGFADEPCITVTTFYRIAR